MECVAMAQSAHNEIALMKGYEPTIRIFELIVG
jgi:hypothetical protein